MSLRAIISFPWAKRPSRCRLMIRRYKTVRSVVVITYGMGVYWAMAAAKNLPGQVEIIDLRCLFPLDEELVFESVRRHGKCLVLTEEATE